jgi:hypothetical protein
VIEATPGSVCDDRHLSPAVIAVRWYTMRKQTTKTQNGNQKTREPRILSSRELQQATGGTDVMKSIHEMEMSVIRNLA